MIEMDVRPCSTIDEVITRMDGNIERCLRENSRLGYFAVMYRGVTARVRAGIAAGEFDDPVRMERLVVIFANRYLYALEQFWNGQKPTRSWSIAFECGTLRRPLVLQHLLLGMNAHINLDLAIAAAQAAAPNALSLIKRDFEHITDLLNNMIDAVQDRIKVISPWFNLIDAVGGRTDEEIVGFAIREARNIAWKAAERLAAADPEGFQEQVALHDEIVWALARKIRSPGPLLTLAVHIVRLREAGKVPVVIEALRAE